MTEFASRGEGQFELCRLFFFLHFAEIDRNNHAACFSATLWPDHPLLCVQSRWHLNTQRSASVQDERVRGRDLFGTALDEGGSGLFSCCFQIKCTKVFRRKASKHLHALHVHPRVFIFSAKLAGRISLRWFALTWPSWCDVSGSFSRFPRSEERKDTGGTVCVCEFWPLSLCLCHLPINKAPLALMVIFWIILHIYRWKFLKSLSSGSQEPLHKHTRLDSNWSWWSFSHLTSFQDEIKLSFDNRDPKWRRWLKLDDCDSH